MISKNRSQAIQKKINNQASPIKHLIMFIPKDRSFEEELGGQNKSISEESMEVKQLMDLYDQTQKEIQNDPTCGAALLFLNITEDEKVTPA